MWRKSYTEKVRTWWWCNRTSIVSRMSFEMKMHFFQRFIFHLLFVNASCNITLKVKIDTNLRIQI